MNTETQLKEIVEALRPVRMPAMPEEYDIHGQILYALNEAGLATVHEYRLAPRCRIDFLVGRIGIEVKKGRPVASQLMKQLSRYLASDSLDAVVVVAQKSLNLPASIHGKPVVLVSLNRLWGVALP